MASLKGRLLVALPALRDPNFDRTVVFMLEHDDTVGAAGVVLNRPSPLTVAEILPEWADFAADPPVAFVGGPVEPRGAIGLADIDGEVQAVDLQAGPTAIAGEVRRLRVFGGYAGWGLGQLEDEIAANAWIDVDGHVEDVFTMEADALWEDVLKRQGGRIAAIADFPDDPRMN